MELVEGSAPPALAAEGFVLARALRHAAGIALGLMPPRLAREPRDAYANVQRRSNASIHEALAASTSVS